MNKESKKDTSWRKVADWYDKTVKEEDSYQKMVMLNNKLSNKKRRMEGVIPIYQPCNQCRGSCAQNLARIFFSNYEYVPR